MPNSRPWKYRFSHTFSWRSRVFVCETTPISCLASAGCATTSMPATNAWPEVGITRVVRIPAVVVLPAPLGPSRPKISPVPTQVERVDGAEVGPGVDLRQVLGVDDRAGRAFLEAAAGRYLGGAHGSLIVASPLSRTGAPGRGGLDLGAAAQLSSSSSSMASMASRSRSTAARIAPSMAGPSPLPLASGLGQS